MTPSPAYSPSLPSPLFLSHSTPVDRRIKEDAPVDSPGDLKHHPPSPPPAKRLPSAAVAGGRQRRTDERARTETVRSSHSTTGVFGEDTPPVYTANVGSNSSWLVAAKSIPDSPCHRVSTRVRYRYGSIIRARPVVSILVTARPPAGASLPPVRALSWETRGT